MKLLNSKKLVFFVGIFILIASIIVSIFVLVPSIKQTKEPKPQEPAVQIETLLSLNKAAYYDLMKSFNENVPEFYYHIKDIDGNGIEELLILENCTLYIYTYDNGNVFQIDSHDFVTGTLQLLESPNYDGIFVLTVGGGYDHYRYLTLCDGSISMTNLCEYYYSADEPYWNDISDDKQMVAEAKKVYENVITFTQYVPLDFQGNDAISFVSGANKYVAVVEFEELTAKNLKIYDDTTKNILQSIPLNRSEEVTTTDRNIYAVDINFDGNLDILIPDMYPARAIFYNAYIYNAKQQKFIEAPSFKDLPNPALDIKNQRVLYSSGGDSMFLYGMVYYDKNENDFRTANTILIEPDNDKYHFVEYSYKNGKESVKNEFHIPLHEFYLYPKSNHDIVPYYEVGSFWDLDSDKWDRLVTTQETDYSVDTTPADNPLLLSQVKKIFRPLLEKAVEVEQSILNDAGTFEYEKEIAFKTDDGSDYSLITDSNFQRIDSVWSYAYTAFTMDAAHRAFGRHLDQTTPSPRFLERDGKLYYNRNNHGYNSDFDINSLEIINQFKNTVIVSIDNYGPGTDENTYYTCIFILQNTENGWRFANTENESHNINPDNYMLKLVAESENQQPAIDAFTNFLNGKIPAKNVVPNKASASPNYIYITDLSCRDLTLLGIDQFTLFDLNDDGIPELITEGYTMDVFSYNNDGELTMIYSSPAGSSSRKYLLQNKKIYWKLSATGTTYEIASFDKELNVTIDTYFDGANASAAGYETYYHNEKPVTAEEFSKLEAEFLTADFLTRADTIWYAYNTSKNSAVLNRNSGEMQPETTDIVTIDGKPYQSYVASNTDIRYVWVSRGEYNMEAEWDWVPVGTKNFYSLDLLGKVNEGRK